MCRLKWIRRSRFIAMVYVTILMEIKMQAISEVVVTYIVHFFVSQGTYRLQFPAYYWWANKALCLIHLKLSCYWQLSCEVLTCPAPIGWAIKRWWLSSSSCAVMSKAKGQGHKVTSSVWCLFAHQSWKKGCSCHRCHCTISKSKGQKSRSPNG